MKNSDIISYILIAMLFVATLVPLIALFVKSIQEQRELDETERVKKSPRV